MSYKIIDLPALGRPFNATDIIEVSANGTGSYKANIGNFTLGGENYIFVNANGTPAQNGAALKSAYLYAQTLTPNGSPLQETNRITILLAPGYYTFNEAVDGPFEVNQSFIDFESLSGNPDVYFSSIQVYGSPIVGLDVRLIGIDTTKNNYYPHAAFAVASIGDTGSEYIVIKNCVGGDYSFSSFSKGFYGLYENCIGGEYSFCSTGFGTSSPAGIISTATGNFSNYGIIKNCTASDYSFVSGAFLPAGTIANFGTIQSCNSTGNTSFCHSVFRAQNAGAIIDCQSYDFSFCTSTDSIGTGSASNIGAIVNCQVYGAGFCVYLGANVSPTCAQNQGLISGCYSSGTGAFVINESLSLGTNSATITNCFMTGQGFCGANGINSGIISNCTAQNNSFCNDTPSGNSGQILRCTLLNDAFTVGATGGGRVVLGIDTTGVVNF